MDNAAGPPGVPRAAATVMLVRDEPGGLAVYLTRRSTASRFMPGVYVFPGGAVEAGDAAPPMLALLYGTAGFDRIADRAAFARAARPAPEHNTVAREVETSALPAMFIVAAVREVFEEAGVLFACDAGGKRVVLAECERNALRAGVLTNVPLSALLGERGLRLDARELVHYSNWITPPTQRIRFDTHFFLARAPRDQVASADAVEVHDGVWLSPAIALRRAERGELEIIFPTRKHLERLARFDTVEPLLAHARERRVAPTYPLERAPGDVVLTTEDETW